MCLETAISNQEVRDWLTAFRHDHTRAFHHIPNLVYAYLRQHNLLCSSNLLTQEGERLVS